MNKEVYVFKSLGFEEHEKHDYVFKIKWVIFDLKQARRAWYEHLSGFFINPRFNRGKVDNALFIRQKLKHILFVQLYIDDILFGSNDESLSIDLCKFDAGGLKCLLWRTYLFLRIKDISS